MGVIAVLWAYPLLWIFSLSLRSNEALMVDTGGLLRGPFTFQNYLDLAVQARVPRWFLNSLVVTSISTVLVLVFATLAASFVHLVATFAEPDVGATTGEASGPLARRPAGPGRR